MQEKGFKTQMQIMGEFFQMLNEKAALVEKQLLLQTGNTLCFAYIFFVHLYIYR